MPQLFLKLLSLFKKKISKIRMNILSIDIGIINMAFIFARIDENYRLKEIISCKNVNICVCNDKLNCKLDHKNFNRMSGKIKHFIDSNEEFKKADIIICEKQPPFGLIIIEELLLFKFPDMYLVSPNAMHAYYEINNYDYEKRKQLTVNISTKKLNKFECFRKNERKHDMADSYCLLKFWLMKTGKELLKKKELEKWRQNNSKIIKCLDSFKYTE